MGGVWRGAAERDRAGDAASDAPQLRAVVPFVCVPVAGAVICRGGENRMGELLCFAIRRFHLSPPPFHGHETLLALWSTYLARGLDPCDTGVLLPPALRLPFDEKNGRPLGHGA